MRGKADDKSWQIFGVGEGLNIRKYEVRPQAKKKKKKSKSLKAR